MDSHKKLTDEIVPEENEEEPNEHDEELLKQESLYRSTLANSEENRSANNSPKHSRPLSRSNSRQPSPSNSRKASVSGSRNEPRLNSAPLIQPAKSIDFSKTRKSLSSLSIHSHLHHSSVNDLKHIGEQFKVGKADPNAKHPCEHRFQAMFQSRLKEASKRDNRLKTRTNLLLSNHIFLANDNKYKGAQFRTGKVAGMTTSSKEKKNFGDMTVEEKFQEMFKDRKKILTPEFKSKSVSHRELKEIHSSLLLKPVPNRFKKS